MFIVTKHKRLYKVLIATFDFIQKLLATILFFIGFICWGSIAETTTILIISKIIGTVAFLLSYYLAKDFEEE